MPCRPALGNVERDQGGAPAPDRYSDGMPLGAFGRRRYGPIRCWLGIAAVVAASVLAAAPAADALDLLATHEVTAQFATADGKPMAGAEVRVFAPGAPQTPVATGRTDAAGKFVFGADRDGMWSAEARTSGQIARIMIRVGSGPSADRGFSAWLVVGALAALLVAAFWYRLRRMRPPAPKP